MSLVPVLETERLVMRGFRDGDQEQWAAIRADDEVMRSLGRDGGIAADEAWREMAMLAGHWALKGFGHWALEERASGALTGRRSRWVGRSPGRAGARASPARPPAPPRAGRRRSSVWAT